MDGYVWYIVIGKLYGHVDIEQTASYEQHKQQWITIKTTTLSTYQHRFDYSHLDLTFVKQYMTTTTTTNSNMFINQ